MKQVFLIILTILAGLIISVVVFGVIQCRVQQDKSADDLTRRVKAIVESELTNIRKNKNATFV